MSKEFQQSLVHRTGLALAAVILLAVINMLASYLTAESSENDAVRINLAGSLRMLSYRIANEYILSSNSVNTVDRSALDQSIAAFEQRLAEPVLATHIQNSDNRVQVDAFALVESGWAALKPALLAENTVQQQVLKQIDRFVEDIDGLVKKLELQTESKFRVLRFIQGVSLLLTVGLASIMFLNVYRYVVGPLNQLVDMAARLRAGDFSRRLNSRGDDELTLLANTFNTMADSLDGMYRTLEEQVRAKTRHLEETQRMLRFLYDTSQRLGEQGNIVDKLERTMDHLQREVGATGVDIELRHTSPDHPFRVSSGPGTRSIGEQETTPASGAGPFERTYLLQNDNREYGYLYVGFATMESVSPEQHLMLTALADTIGVALANEARKDQEHRMALIEERTAIARELHDSIAQSLSFTKIQASRLQSLLAKNAAANQLEEVIMEIRSGIQSAYAQLRELLTTFRLQLDSPGLQASLATTAKEFEDRGNLSISLQSSLQNYPLTANEEIHILQIVREGLSNVLRHSGADKVRIQLALDPGSGMIEVHLSDNGGGFDVADPDQNHYGKVIMQERAEILGGAIEFSNTPAGGAKIVLRFTPEQVSSRNSSHQDFEPAPTGKASHL